MHNVRTSLLGWAVLLGCAACQHREPEQETSTKQLTTTAPVTSPAAAPADQPEQLELLAVGDSIGPRPLDFSLVGPTQLRAELADEPLAADTVAGRFLIIKARDTPRLLYRTRKSDTIWTELDRLFERYEHGETLPTVEVRQANLDGQGQPEVLVSFNSASYGSGGGLVSTSHYLLDVTRYPPLLLLQACTGAVDETFGAYAAMHGDTLDPDAELYNGYERTVKLRPREVVLGPIKLRGRAEGQTPADAGMTPLPTGRYRYQQGHMYRVKVQSP